MSMSMNGRYDDHSTIDGGTALCAVVIFGVIVGLASGAVTLLVGDGNLITGHNRVVDTIVAALIGCWIGTACACGMVAYRRFATARAELQSPTLKQRLHFSLKRTKQVLAMEYTAQTGVEATVWRHVSETLTKCVEEQCNALEEIEKQPRKLLTQAFLDRFVQDVVLTLQQEYLSKEDNFRPHFEKCEIENAARLAVSTVLYRTPTTSTRDYLRVFTNLLITMKRPHNTQVVAGLIEEASGESCNSTELRDLFKLATNEFLTNQESSCGITATGFEGDATLVNLLLQLQFMGKSLIGRAANPYLDLYTAITEAILAISADDDEAEKLTAAFRTLDETSSAAASNSRTDNGWQLELSCDANADILSLEIIRHAARLRAVEALINNLRIQRNTWCSYPAYRHDHNNLSTSSSTNLQ